jgi:hypothetical protein
MRHASRRCRVRHAAEPRGRLTRRARTSREDASSRRARDELAGIPADVVREPGLADDVPGHDDAASWAAPRVVEPGD